MNQNKQQFSHPLYMASSPTDKTVLVALDVLRQNDMITWFDTIRHRMFEILEVVEDRLDRFVFKSKRDRIYTLIPMTLEIYQREVRPWLIAPEDVRSMKELVDKFQETKKYAW